MLSSYFMQHRLYGLRGKAYIDRCKEIFKSDQYEIARAFSYIVADNGKFTPPDLGKLCNQFCLPVTVMDRFLSELHLLPTGTWQRLRDRGCKAKDIGVEWSDDD